jgi:peptidoglycan DL-endopeptidase CwlO
VKLPRILAVAIVLVLSAGITAAVRAQGANGSHHGESADAPFLAASGAGAPASASALVSTSPNTSHASAIQGISGFQVPASGVPVDGSTLPAGQSGQAYPFPSFTALPTPTRGSLQAVRPLKEVLEPDAVVMLKGPLTQRQRATLSAIKGINAIEVVDTGTVSLAGAPVVEFGVDPGTFRAFTPAASASSDRLWQYLASGSLISSYEMATDRKLALGSNADIHPAGAPHSTVQGWLGGFASIGLPGVDLLVSNRYAPQMGLTPNSGLIVSAAQEAGQVLQTQLQRALPGSAVELLHPDQISDAIAGNTLTGTMRQKLIAAALSRVGHPYVWGGAGPQVFDCSGLVQWSYLQAGVLMPRVAAEQFLTGIHIPLADAQPGDLLFWTEDPNDPGYVDHTAIYLGNGMMVVAPHTDLNVEVVPVDVSNFAGALRVLLR